MVLLKVISDLHLNRSEIDPDEVLTRENIPPIDKTKHAGQSTVLAILGDIGSNYEELFSFVSTLGYDYILFVAGNHEYYGHSIQRRQTYLKELCSKYSIKFLNRDSITIDGVLFIGATLWTFIPERLRSIALDHLKEVKLIKWGFSKMTINRYVELHREDVSWIRKHIQERRNVQSEDSIVVLTHHSPSFKLCRYCSDGEINNDVNVYFASHLDDLVDDVTLWCCGHIHDSNVVDNMIVNAYAARNYNPNLVIDLDDTHQTFQEE